MRRGAPARPRGAPAGARRGDHLSLPRPLDGRPRGVPHQGAGRRVAQARPDRRPSRASSRRRASSRTARPRSSTRRRSSASTRPCAFADECRVPAARVALRPHLRPRRPGARAGTRSTSAPPACTGRGRARALRRAERGPTDAYGDAVEQASREDLGLEKASDQAQAEDDDAEEDGDGLMAVVRYREALNQALREEMQRDESVFLMGEDIGVFNGAFKVTNGLLEEFGEKRVRDTPISENTIVGMGVGAAMTGLRPVVELMTINFSLLALDQIVNHMATIHYMFGGQVDGADGRADAAGRRPPARPDPLALPGGALPPRARDARRRAVDAGRRQGAAEVGDPRRQPGRLHRARVPLRPARRGARRRGPPRSTSARPRSAARATT